jgi:multiple sugar transport system permease protein
MIVRPLQRLLLYALLTLGAAVFLLPLAWMVSTALKPIDQTLSMPPTWIPTRAFAPAADGGGAPVEVRRGETVTAPSLLVEAAGSRRVVPADAVRDGWLVEAPGPDGTPRAVPASVLQAIPATAAAPWALVTDVGGEARGGRAVPAAAVVRRASPRWENFGQSIRKMQCFPRYLANTLLLCLLTVAGTVLSSALAAYGFSRIQWRGRNSLFLLALATMMVPFPVVMVPVYCLFRWLGWIGTFKPLWVGSFCAGAFNVFLLRQFFLTIPRDLSEAARMDGCSEFRIFWQVVLPLSRPALMVVGLFQFMGTWNDFLGPLIYLTKQKDFTLALGLQFFQSQHGGTEWHYLMAASTIIALPIVVLFFFAQRTFIEGISMTGIKA